jgi:hypothetical protein
MHYVGVAIDASSREVRLAFIDEVAPSTAPVVRVFVYGSSELPKSLRDLHSAVRSTLLETPARALGLRRQDASDRAVRIGNAVIDRFLAEGAVLAAARDLVNDVEHITGADAASRLGVDKPQALTETKAMLTSHGMLLKWADAYMVARSLL